MIEKLFTLSNIHAFSMLVFIILAKTVCMSVVCVCVCVCVWGGGGGGGGVQSPVQRQNITWTNGDLISIGHVETV